MGKLDEIAEKCKTIAENKNAPPDVKQLAAAVGELAAEVGILDHRNAASMSHHESPPANINEI
jgi:hypothetical protein